MGTDRGYGGGRTGILERADGQVEIVTSCDPPLGTTRTSMPPQVRGGVEAEALRLNRRSRRHQLREGVRCKAPGKGLRGCGRTLVAVHERVDVRLTGGVAHFTGLMTCGLVWMCPVCSPKIRHGRALTVERGLNRALEMGHGIEFVTLTSRHHLGQALADLFSRSQKAFNAMRTDKSFRTLMARFTLRWIMVREVLYGPINGWHPHFHLAVITWVPLTPTERAELEEGFWRGWSHQLQRVGLSAMRGPGVLVKPCTSADGLAGYLCKVEADDGATRSLSLELTRSDLKRAGGVLRTPEQILEDYLDTGDLADLALLEEYWNCLLYTSPSPRDS